MREFIPSDYVDKEGNVYETVGENIREGKNSVIDIGFPTPEELGNGLIGSDGKKYVSKLKNLGETKNLDDSTYVIRSLNNVLSFESPISNISDNTKVSTPPMSLALVNYINSKLPYLNNANIDYIEITTDSELNPSITSNVNNIPITVSKSNDSTLIILSTTKIGQILDLIPFKVSTENNFNISINTICKADNSIYKTIKNNANTVLGLYVAIRG